MHFGKNPLNLYIFSYSQMVCGKATWQMTSNDSIPSKYMGMLFKTEYHFHKSGGNGIPIPFQKMKSCEVICQVAFPQQMWKYNLTGGFSTTNVGKLIQ